MPKKKMPMKMPKGKEMPMPMMAPPFKKAKKSRKKK